MADTNRGADVAVTISGEERDLKSTRAAVTESPHRKSVDSHPENAVFMPSPNRPPRIPNPETLTRRKSLARSVYSKPKSRFGEPSLIDHQLLDEMLEPAAPASNSSRASPRVASNTTASPNGTSFKETPRTISMTPKTPFMASPGGGWCEYKHESFEFTGEEKWERHKDKGSDRCRQTSSNEKGKGVCLDYENVG